MKLTRSEAARLNGAKSKGPVTAEGKAASSRNAVKHGILAGAVVLANENPEEFAALQADYYAQYQPATPTERDLVDEMVIAKWRQRRAWAMETAAIDHQMDLDAPVLARRYAKMDEPTRSALAIQHRLEKTRDLDVYDRYDRRFHRQFLRCLRTLQHLQQAAAPRP